MSEDSANIMTISYIDAGTIKGKLKRNAFSITLT